MEFLDEPKQSPRWTQEGLYTSYTFGENNKKIKIIILDVRYFAEKDNILGEKQWIWLEN